MGFVIIPGRHRAELTYKKDYSLPFYLARDGHPFAKLEKNCLIIYGAQAAGAKTTKFVLEKQRKNRYFKTFSKERGSGPRSGNGVNLSKKTTTSCTNYTEGG